MSGFNSGIKSIPLDAIQLSEKNLRSLRKRKHVLKIERIRSAFENDEEVEPIRVVAVEADRFHIQDGRHRFLAAKAAGYVFIEAIVA